MDKMVLLFILDQARAIPGEAPEEDGVSWKSMALPKRNMS